MSNAAGFNFPGNPVMEARRIVAPAARIERKEALSNDVRFLARVAREAPRVPWANFYHNLPWKNGEHFALIGPTGYGKTTMLVHLLDKHKYVTVFATKPEDETMDGLIQHAGYLRLDRWRSLDPKKFPRRVLWPDASHIDSIGLQREVFHDAFAKIYREGGWTVALDETWYVSNVLKLEADIKMYLLQARSLDISLAAAFQRPAWVPRELYSSCTHIMIWKTNDEEDLKSLSGIGAISAELIREIVMRLEPHQVLYVNTRTGQMCRTRSPEVRFTEGR